jgi:hypothetical protein
MAKVHQGRGAAGRVTVPPYALSFVHHPPPVPTPAPYAATKSCHDDDHHDGRYIRYIYNRIILENATVRAAAVSALARFGAQVPQLTPRVEVLLRRALYDNDDEVCVWARARLAVCVHVC